MKKEYKDYTKHFASMYFINYIVYALINSQRKTFLIEIGYNVEQIALIYAVIPFITITMQLLIGHLSDKFRTIKKIIITLVVLSSVISYFYYSVQVQYFIFHFALSLLSYSLCYSVTELSDVWVLESKGKAGRQYGFIRAFGSAGWAVGSFLLANILITFGFSGLALTILLVSIVLLGIMVLIADDKAQVNMEGTIEAIKFSDVTALFKDHYYLITIMIVFFVNMAVNMSSYMIIDKILFLGGAAYIISIKDMIAASVEIPTMMIGDRVHRKLGSITMIIIGTVAFIIQYTGYYFATSNTVILIFTLSQVLSVPFFNIGIKYLLLEMSPDHLKTTGQMTGPALVNGTTSFLYPIISAILMTTFKVDTPFILAVVCCIIGVILALILNRKYAEIKKERVASHL